MHPLWHDHGGDVVRRDMFVAFVAELESRMDKGAAEYGDRSWDADPVRLIAELQEEAADIAGWASILWSRLARMKLALEAIRLEAEKHR